MLADGVVEVMTRYLVKEVGPWRIAVTTVAPGAVQTDFPGRMLPWRVTLPR